MKHVVQYSGGVSSWGSAYRVWKRYGRDDMILLFADTMMEDEDLYRFSQEGADFLGLGITVVRDGRDPFQIFKDKRFMGNSRIDPCSHHLKRHLLNKWIVDNCDPDDTVIHLGIDPTEEHRKGRYAARMEGWDVCAPLCDYDPPVFKPTVFGWLDRIGIKKPRLYDMGFHHNNCGGFCVKAGQAQFRQLLRVRPEFYRWCEEQEQEVYDEVETAKPFLQMTRDGVKRYLTLKEFREHIEIQPDLFDAHDWGGCGCALD